MLLAQRRAGMADLGGCRKVRESLDGAEVLFVALPTAVGEEARDLRLGHRLSLSGSMRPLCIDAAHFATVDSLRPSAEAASFQLTLLQELVHLLLACQGCPFLASGTSKGRPAR